MEPCFNTRHWRRTNNGSPAPTRVWNCWCSTKNEATGGVTVLRKFHAGTTVPAHVHPLANESVYILSGEWEESGVTYHPGTFFHAPRGERHGPHVAKTEVISLTVFDGPLTVQS